jgi:hypothetical protein
LIMVQQSSQVARIDAVPFGTLFSQSILPRRMNFLEKGE